MGVYVTRQQLVDRYGTDRLVDLTDRGEPPAGGIVDAVLDRAIADAGEEVDAHLAARYALPLSPPVPAVLVTIAAQLAYAALHVETAPDKVTADARAARDMLRRIASADLKLVGVAGAEAPSASGVAVASGPDRLFGRDGLAGY
jgi:phage gp36-like protein